MANIVTPNTATPKQPTLPPGIVPDFCLVQQQFPKVAEKITLMWGTLGLHEYLNKPSSTNARTPGISLPIVSALMRLHEYHSTLIPVARTMMPGITLPD